MRSNWDGMVSVCVSALAVPLGVDRDRLIGPERHARIADVRAIAMWVLRASGLSYPAIGDALHRHHTTCIHGVKRVEKTPELFTRAMDICDRLMAARRQMEKAA
jgi:chromosomal replication initiation ATPase DnaA